MKPLYRIADLSFGSSRWDGVHTFEFRGKNFEVQRFGTDFSVEALAAMIKHLRHQVDAFAISSLPSEIRFNDKTYVHRQALEIMSTPSSVPICNGNSVRELSNIDGLARAIQSGAIRPELGIFFPIGVMHMECVRYLRDSFKEHLYFGDLYALSRAPLIVSPGTLITNIAKLGLNVASLMDLRGLAPTARRPLSKMARSALLAQLTDVRYVMADPAVLTLFGTNLDFIRGKDVILPYNHPGMGKELRSHEPSRIITLLQPAFRNLNSYVSHSVLDAVLRLALEKSAPLSLEEWQEVLNSEARVSMHTRRFVIGARPSAQVRLTTRLKRLGNRLAHEPPPDFAFIVHSLSFDQIYKAPGLRSLKKLPRAWHHAVEHTAAKLPGFLYGHARGIISQKNGREINGIIYALLSTPKMMREDPPEVTYGKIERLCNDAAERGVKILGLGAYIKVVGDAGSTINRHSPIPITTGNSLSASATLWALHETIRRMEILHLDPNTQRVDGVACVIGATGSIGKVSAKLLSMAFNKLYLVAPKLDRLRELADEIRRLSPACEVRVSTDANELAPMCDALITATSSFDQKIVDIERLKPGCVVCDCSRPLDFKREDIVKRPDVLVIESGEVILPGRQPQLDCDIALPENIVYACLAETAVLAMEGMYEPFTIGRDIQWEKVKRIYKLAREHGVQLAAIRSHAGVVSDKEIALVRELAIKKRANQRSS